MYEYRKAVYHKDFETAINISFSSNNFQVRKFIQGVACSFDWYDIHLQEMQEIYKLKLEEHANVKEMLLSTRHLSLVECNKYNRIWANGHSERDSLVY